MADPGLLHRADCHASGTASIAGWVADPESDASPIGLCAHHLRESAAELVRKGWVIERVNDDCDTEVVKA